MKSFLNGFSSGLGRAFGRIIAIALIGFLLFNFFNNNKDDIKSTIKEDIKDVIPFE